MNKVESCSKKKNYYYLVSCIDLIQSFNIFEYFIKKNIWCRANCITGDDWKETWILVVCNCIVILLKWVPVFFKLNFNDYLLKCKRITYEWNVESYMYCVCKSGKIKILFFLNMYWHKWVFLQEMSKTQK